MLIKDKFKNNDESFTFTSTMKIGDLPRWVLDHFIFSSIGIETINIFYVESGRLRFIREGSEISMEEEDSFRKITIKSNNRNNEYYIIPSYVYE